MLSLGKTNLLDEISCWHSVRLPILFNFFNSSYET